MSTYPSPWSVPKPYETVVSTETLGAPGTFTLVTIPQTYREVVFRVVGKTLAAALYDYCLIELNGDSTPVYSRIKNGRFNNSTAAGGAAGDNWVSNGQTSAYLSLLGGGTGAGTVESGFCEAVLTDYTLPKGTHILRSQGGVRGTVISTATELVWFAPVVGPTGPSAISTVEVVNAANFDTGSTFTVLGRGPL